MLSAPFVMQRILPSSVLTITDILFLSEVNSITFSNSYLSLIFECLSHTMMLLSASRSSNSMPKCLAAFVRASSSGEEALYNNLLSFF